MARTLTYRITGSYPPFAVELREGSVTGTIIEEAVKQSVGDYSFTVPDSGDYFVVVYDNGFGSDNARIIYTTTTTTTTTTLPTTTTSTTPAPTTTTSTTPAPTTTTSTTPAPTTTTSTTPAPVTVDFCNFAFQGQSGSPVGVGTYCKNWCACFTPSPIPSSYQMDVNFKICANITYGSFGGTNVILVLCCNNSEVGAAPITSEGAGLSADYTVTSVSNTDTLQYHIEGTTVHTGDIIESYAVVCTTASTVSPAGSVTCSDTDGTILDMTGS